VKDFDAIVTCVDSNAMLMAEPGTSTNQKLKNFGGTRKDNAMSGNIRAGFGKNSHLGEGGEKAYFGTGWLSNNRWGVTENS